MFPTSACLSKASRRALTPKRGNKDFYKGTRQATLPGGLRTGAPGKHVIGGKAKYRLLDEKVRVFVAPPISQIAESPLKPYVGMDVKLTRQEQIQGPGVLTGKRLYKLVTGLEAPFDKHVNEEEAAWLRLDEEARTPKAVSIAGSELAASITPPKVNDAAAPEASTIPTPAPTTVVSEQRV